MWPYGWKLTECVPLFESKRVIFLFLRSMSLWVPLSLLFPNLWSRPSEKHSKLTQRWHWFWQHNNYSFWSSRSYNGTYSCCIWYTQLQRVHRELMEAGTSQADGKGKCSEGAVYKTLDWPTYGQKELTAWFADSLSSSTETELTSKPKSKPQQQPLQNYAHQQFVKCSLGPTSNDFTLFML